MRTSAPRSILRYAFVGALGLVLGCPSPPPPVRPADAGVDVPRDARGRQGRRRRRARVRVASRTPQGTTAPPVGPQGPIEDDPPEAPRVRGPIPERGPVLTDNLGPPPEAHFDMAAGQEGPMGLSPEQVRQGLEPLMPRFVACVEWGTDDEGHGPRGRVPVRLRIHNDGRPVAARVSGAGGSAEFVTCVRRVVAAARFDRFAGPDVMATWGFDVD